MKIDLQKKQKTKEEKPSFCPCLEYFIPLSLYHQKEINIFFIMDLDIQLGSPRHNCDRFGICRMDNLTKNKGFLPKEGKALANITLLAAQTILLRFYRNSIATDTFNKHFSNGFFSITATATPSGNVFKALGIKPFSLEAGQYPIRLTKGYAEVRMTYSNAAHYADCACTATIDSG